MRIAIYSRKSIETDTGESIKNQIKICKEYFERQYSDCKYEIFEDEGFSGSNTNRPAFKRMMLLIKAGQFDIIAVYKIDRIARNIVDFVNIYDEFENLNVKLVSITEGFDPSTPAGKMMMLMIASFAEMERMNIAQRVKDNMRELAKLGRWSGGTPPTGYKTHKEIENGKKVTYLELIEEESENIIEMFKLYAQGYSSQKISKYFKSKGFNYPPKTVYNLLLNPTYLISSEESIKYLENCGYTVYGKPNGCGFLPYNRRPRTKGIKSWNDKNKFVGVSKHKAIIDLDLWIAVQEKFNEKSIEPHPRESSFTFLSGGMLKCKCGQSMYVDPGKTRKDGHRFYYFRCIGRKTGSECKNDSIRVDVAEKYIHNYFKELTNDKNALSEFLNKDNDKDYSKEINIIKKSIISNERAISNLIDKLELLSNEAAIPLSNRIEELVSQNNTLKEEAFKLEREQILQQQYTCNIDYIYNKMLLFLDEKMSIDGKRECLKAIAKNIIWDSDTKILDVIPNE